MSKDKIKHLLRPKEFRVWCMPHTNLDRFDFTTKAFDATCANCLTAWRTATTGRSSPFRTRDVIGRRPTNGEWEPRMTRITTDGDVE